MKKKIFIFTDLDGSLLHRETFNFDIIKSFIKKCHSSGIFIIPNSSKTKIEIENFLEKLGLELPFIVENGSAIYNLYLLDKSFPKEKILSRSKEDLLKIFNENFHYSLKTKIKLLEKMPTKEVVEILGQPLDGIRQAMDRHYTHPFIFNGSESEKLSLIEKAHRIGINIQEGDRLLSLGDNLNKSKAMLDVLSYFNRDDIVTIGIGDNKNDIEMLDSSDFPCLIRNNNFNFEGLDNKNYIFSEKEAPLGWQEVVELVLEKIETSG